MELTKLEYQLKRISMLTSIRIIKKTVIYINKESIIAMEENHTLKCGIAGEEDASLITLSCGREYYIEQNYELEEHLT